MIIRQVVQVKIEGAARSYTYGYDWDTEKEQRGLLPGDRVELPANEVSPEGSSGKVVQLGSSYRGEMRTIVRRIPDDDGHADGWCQGCADYGLCLDHDPDFLAME